MSTFDTLPSELQREVFEWASVDSERPVNAAMALSYVCHRVKIWMDYIIYRHVFLDSGIKFHKFIETFDAKPADFFQDRVQSLFISGDIGHIAEVTTYPSYHSWRQSLRILDISAEDAFHIDFKIFPNLAIVSLYFWLRFSLFEDEIFEKILARNVFGIDGGRDAEPVDLKQLADLRVFSSKFNALANMTNYDPRLVVLPCFAIENWMEEVTGLWSYWDLARLEALVSAAFLVNRLTSLYPLYIVIFIDISSSFRFRFLSFASPFPVGDGSLFRKGR
ncbi:hypothetical protein D9758_010017 [Tetrapyrgos nigripes]|uniref:Uncharacterized protein n=1 Tax=Tetrapyrgos nigripes TaxID=182062 RepID=A0A8H5CVB4_9AGAR|nr:hypothetical protein D9758_010017 [Tetrapyrgos nigripes]